MNDYSLTNFLAQLIGVMYLTVGFGVFFNVAYYLHIFKEISRDRFVLYFSGIATAMFGFSIIYFHNICEFSLAGVVTFIGWMAFIKGISLIVIPNMIINIYRKFVFSDLFLKISMFVLVIIGTLLLFWGKERHF